jgi:hypothetical protein
MERRGTLAAKLQAQVAELEAELAAAQERLAEVRTLGDALERKAMDAVRAGNDVAAKAALIAFGSRHEEAKYH